MLIWLIITEDAVSRAVNSRGDLMTGKADGTVADQV